MKFGHYSDEALPVFDHPGYETNSHGYRCPEWDNIPDGGKNLVVLGCSHTFGEGLIPGELWVDKLKEKCHPRVRWWNLAQPGASADLMTRILYSSEKTLYPELILACWPAISRREYIDTVPVNLTSNDHKLKYETDNTDLNNFYKNVFLVEKFAEKNNARVFHCFAQETVPLESNFVYRDKTLTNCWPVWDNWHGPSARKMMQTKANLARDGIHCGELHQIEFANLLFTAFGNKLK